MNPAEDADGPIRITREQALSRHVDGLLQRQRSMRGQGGVGATRQPPWYMRSFFVFGVAGLLGAVVAWALIEPSFNDMQYLQGPIEDVRWGGGAGWGVPVVGTIELAGERLPIPKGVLVKTAEGRRVPLDPSSFRVGQDVGLYVDQVMSPRGDLNAVAILVVDPPPGRLSPPGELARLTRRTRIAGFLLFAVVAGLVGLFIGAADGLVCRLPGRAFLAGGVGLVVGVIGGLVMTLVAGAVYYTLSSMAQSMMASRGTGALGFLVQVAGRGLAWMFAGTAMGLGQGIALRSKKLFVFGLLGGIVGGLSGGLLFDPIDLILLGPDKPSAHWSRLVGLATIGASVGAMMGIVELLARDAWLRMTEGPLAGKEFLLFKDLLRIGSSSQSDVYLFNDNQVASHHATLRTVGDEYEIENHARNQPVLINGRPVQRSRLRHGDQVAIGRAVFLFQRRKS